MFKISVFNVIAPTICLSLLSLFCFWLPSESGEKITLGISLVLTFTLFQLLVNSRTPRSSDFIPLVSTYLTVAMSMAAFVIFFQVFVLNLYSANDLMKRPPYWLRFIADNIIAKILCCTRQAPEQTAADPVVTMAKSYLDEKVRVRLDKIGKSGKYATSDESSPMFTRRFPDGTEGSNLAGVEKEDHLLERLSSAVTRMATREVRRIKAQVIANEWRSISSQVDRLLFWLFFLAICIITLAFLYLIPQIEDTSHHHASQTARTAANNIYQSL